MAAKDERGRAGEQRAARYLEQAGWRVLDRNWRCAQGEVDIVATCADSLVVVEVKTRRSDAFGHPLEAVDERKRRRLWQLAFAWLAAHPDLVQGRRLRLDVIAITGDDPATAPLEHVQDLR
ncbi:MULTISPECIES: YraN family protein [unclassified Microbacterium]|uniref:YraN family protein n=1 Tax=unclassified Microbacterium TaxID=2609290 RepID=UPI00214C76F6|nr:MULTISPECIES: YraN family protein [unclassified Microbacterium]MCR2801070.1 YraN family protein [Microbacterium sp. zg.Y818]MCR2826846.1 YraN family protein [Microbacterium sp. zg.Y909]WIM23773.1 YraN family protein [Microbacterium sp. zg-Y818]